MNDLIYKKQEELQDKIDYLKSAIRECEAKLELIDELVEVIENEEIANEEEETEEVEDQVC